MNLRISRRQLHLALAVSLLTAGLSACGGGGGGGTSTPAASAAIDIDNAAVITREVIEVGLGAGAFGVAVGGGGILSADGGSNALAQGLARRRATLQQVQPLQAFGPETIDCLASGTVRLSGSLDNADTLTQGDRITFDFDNCDDADGAVYDGRIRLDVTSFSGDIFGDQYALGTGVLLTGLAITEGGLTTVGDGAFHLDLDLSVPLVSDTAMSGSLLRLHSATDSWTLWDFDVAAVEDGTGANLLTQYSGTGTLEAAGIEGAVDFVSISPLVATGDDYPATGEVLITGANGATIRATAMDSQNLQLAIDLDGDGVVDDTQQMAWSTVGGLGLPAGQNQL